MLHQLRRHPVLRPLVWGLVGLLIGSTGRLSAAPSAPALTLPELQAAYPDVHLHQVSMSEFQSIAHRPIQMAQVIVAPPPTPTPPMTGRLGPLADEPTSSTPLTNEVIAATNAIMPAVRKAQPEVTSSSPSGGIYISDFGGIDSSEAAVVVFVVAGVVVVAAAVIYSGALLANLVLRPEETEVWADTSARTMFFSGSSQQGYMAGGALTLGLKGDGADVGVVLEGGYLDADVVTIDDQEVAVANGYFLVGPSIRWPLDYDEEAAVFEAELLAGSGSEYDLISRASFAFTWSILGPWRAGLRAGALYLDVKEEDGPVWKAGEDFNLLGGLETSIRF